MVTGIACIGERLGDEREGPVLKAQHRNGSVAILHRQVQNILYRTAQGFANRVHFEIHQIVEGINDPNFKSEISFNAKQKLAKYGVPGSVRLDLLERSVPGTTCIYDYKTGNAKLTLKRAGILAAMASKHFPGTVRIIVTQVKPR